MAHFSCHSSSQFHRAIERVEDQEIIVFDVCYMAPKPVPRALPPRAEDPVPRALPFSGRGPSPLGSPPSGRGPRGAHWLQITVSCVKERIVGRMKKGRKKQREGVKGGGWIKIRQILSTATSIQSSNHKTNKKTTEANNSVNKLIDRGSWEKLQNVC